MKLQAYKAQYATAILDKPADADIGNQVVTVSEDGLVNIRFNSSDEAELISLRDWLNGLITEV